MNSKQLKSYFIFQKEQRKAILFLLLIIAVLQLIYFFADFSSLTKDKPEKQQWLSLQGEIDKSKRVKSSNSFSMYPFNPNYITDYKGYKMGMSVQEIDKLLLFRRQNKYVNSAKEFQNVTGISDSLLKIISPYFKFPDWVNGKKSQKPFVDYADKNYVKKENVPLLDLNKASKEDLIKIYGVGEALSARILKEKELLGGFVSMEQLRDIWGLSADAVDGLMTHFKIYTIPAVKKLDINNASIKDIAHFSFFSYGLAKQIVTYRSMNGDFETIEDLTKIKGFPVEKANIIALYLDFN
jgi:DNA uptake protein ComE-like DNA-binding protein